MEGSTIYADRKGNIRKSQIRFNKLLTRREIAPVFYPYMFWYIYSDEDLLI